MSNNNQATPGTPLIPKKEKEIPWINRYLCIPGMLLFGTCTVVIQKIFFSQTVYIDGKPHSCEKPWFQTEMMFIGMLSCLAVYYIEMLYDHCKKKNAVPEKEIPLTSAVGDVRKDEPHPDTTGWGVYVVVCIPAICDLVATCIMNIGLVLIPASVWQMLRGTMVIFSACITMILLSKRIFGFQWFSICVVVVGEVIVALACVLGDTQPTKKDDSGKKDKKSAGDMVLGILLTVGAQIIQASQIVIEEMLLHGISLAPSLIVGIEGFWGTIICTLLLILVYYIPNKTRIGKKFHEDTIDTFNILKHSKGLIGLLVAYVLAILFYNLFGMMVTQTYSAVHRTLIEAMRTLFIWIANIIIYWIDKGKHALGEKVTLWSLCEFGGFAVLVVGTFTYNRVFEIPGIPYPSQEEVQAAKTDQQYQLKLRRDLGFCPVVFKRITDEQREQVLREFQAEQGL